MLKHLQTRDQWDEKNLAEKGFTLIELLVVIIILGILAGVAIFAIGGVREKADENACVNEKDTVEVAVEAFALATGVSPSTVDLSDLTTGTDAQLSKPPKYWTVANGNVTRTGAAIAGCT